MVFESYQHFEHAVVAQDQENSASALEGCWLADKDDADLNMARLERLIDRRPELINVVKHVVNGRIFSLSRLS